jgi:hypothetical protein
LADGEKSDLLIHLFSGFNKTVPTPVAKAATPYLGLTYRGTSICGGIKQKNNLFFFLFIEPVFGTLLAC